MTKHLTNELISSGREFRDLLSGVIGTLDQNEGVVSDDTIDEVIKLAQLYQAASLFWREDSALRFRAAGGCQSLMEGLAGLTPDGSMAVSNVQTLTSDFLTREVALPHWSALIAAVEEIAGRVASTTDRRQKLGHRHELELALFDLEEAFSGGASVEVIDPPPTEDPVAALEDEGNGPSEDTSAPFEEDAVEEPAAEAAPVAAPEDSTSGNAEAPENSWDSSLFEGLDMETGDLLENDGLDMLDMDIGD